MNYSIESTNEVLNDLIKINNDRIEGYLKAEKEAEDIDAEIRVAFTNMANQSTNYVADLKAELANNGGEATDGTTVMGKIYRVWMDIKTSLSANDKQSILNACEYGEDAAQRAYETALREDDLTSSARVLIARQREELRHSHDLVKNYRDEAVLH